MMMWGCSSDSDDNGQGNHSSFVPSASPTWAMDWSSDATAPDWKEPDVTRFECSMTMLVSLQQSLAAYSTDRDVMAVFVDGDCRGVSYRNKLANGRVEYLLLVKGTSEETGHAMELRYYCDSLHHMNVLTALRPFEPSNLMDEKYHIHLGVENGSGKYPVSTQVTLMLPQTLPFTVNPNDKLAVFVDGECRGIGASGGDLYDGWRVMVYSRQAGETAQIRYYSAAKGGTYTILKTFSLSGSLQQEDVSF
jgi:hypothetical protein